MRIVRTGTNPGLTLLFVKNYLKIDADIIIEDDIVQAAIDAALDETTELLMYAMLMDTYDLILPKAEAIEAGLNTIRPVQRFIDAKVKKWDTSNDLVDVTTLTEDVDYTYEIDRNQQLSVTLTESGKASIEKGQYLVLNVFAGEYDTISDVPASITKAMLKMIGDMVESRVDVDNVKGGDWRASDRQIWLRRQWHF